MSRVSGIKYSLHREKVNKFEYILSIYNEIYTGNDLTIEEVIDRALQNLFNNVKNYTLKNYYCKDPVQIQVWINKDVYLKMANLARENPGVSYSSIINFALDRYYLPFIIEVYREIIDKSLSNKDSLLKLLNHYELSVSAIKDSYILTDCPFCGEERFYFNYDNKKNKVFVGCYNDECSFANSYGTDIYMFFQVYLKKDYRHVLIDIFEILFKK